MKRSHLNILLLLLSLVLTAAGVYAVCTPQYLEAGGTARLVSSENGKGARFELRLPISDVSETRP